LAIVSDQEKKKYFEKLAAKYRIKPFEFDSPYAASIYSIPDFVPPTIPNQGQLDLGVDFK